MDKENTKKDDKGLVSIIRNRFSSLKTTHTEFFDNADAFYQMYRSAMQQDEAYPWDYQLTDPLIFSLIRNIMSRLNPEKMKIDLNPTSEDALKTRTVNMRLLEWELREINKTLVFYRAMWGGLIKGRSYLETGWKYEPAVKVETSNEDGSVVQKVYRDIVNRADVKNVRFEDVYVPNLNEPDIENQPYLLQRVCLTFGDMLADNENTPTWKLKCLDYIKKHKVFSNKVDYGDDYQDESSVGDEVGGEEKNEESFNGQYIKMIKMQTKENKVYYILEDESYDTILNEDTDNKYWHGHYNLISWTPFPEDYKYFSLGIVQPLADIAIASSSVLNQYLTNNRKSANPMWVVGADGAQTPDYQFTNRPDGVIRVTGDVNQVKQISSLDSTNTMLAMRTHLQQTFEKSASMSSLYSSGVSDGSSSSGVNKTAGGARIISGNIDANMQLLLGLFSSQLLSKIGDHFLELNAQYITEEQVIRITGEEGKNFLTVKPEEISANFDVYVNPYTIEKVTPQVKQSALLNLKMAIDQEQQIKIDKGPIWKSILSSFPEVDGIDNIILDPSVQAKDAIGALLKEVMPVINDSIDFKTVRQKVQLYMIENQNILSDEQVMLFTEYVDKLTNWMKSQQQLFTAEAPPQQPLPTNMEDLLMSMEQTGVKDGPQQPFAIPADQT